MYLSSGQRLGTSRPCSVSGESRKYSSSIPFRSFLVKDVTVILSLCREHHNRGESPQHLRFFVIQKHGRTASTMSGHVANSQDASKTSSVAIPRTGVVRQRSDTSLRSDYRRKIKKQLAERVLIHEFRCLGLLDHPPDFVTGNGR